MTEVVVAALGGNALLRRGERPELEVQRRNARAAAAALAPVTVSSRLVVTHGNGPQVGLLAEAGGIAGPMPLDVLDAETEGMIGYLLEQEMAGVAGNDIVTLLTRVAVDAGDPAFAKPTKPIGPVYDERTAHRLASDRGWTVAPDGAHWRRVVPSPAPRSIPGMRAIDVLVEAGFVVVCAGGGGVPVTMSPDGRWQGVEAVVDKDRTSALLAIGLGASVLLLLTDVDAVYAQWGTPREHPIGRVGVASLDPSSFEPGSMGPKVAAARSFVRATRGRAAIGALEDAAALLAGDVGTQIVLDDGEHAR